MNAGCCLQGLVRSIGVSNFSVKKLEAVLSYAEIPPAVCQVWLAVQVDMSDTHSILCLVLCRGTYAPVMPVEYAGCGCTTSMFT